MTTITDCLNEHLVDKLKTPNVVPPEAWFESAAKHHASSALIVNDDPAGAVQLAWSAMHDIAKGAAASAGYRLEGETHVKVAAFLACWFADDLEATALGLIRMVQGGRNLSSYDDPRVRNNRLTGDAVNLAGAMLRIAIATLTPPPVAEGDT
jgi:hypothetical protein